MSRFRLSRRTVLRGMGTMIALPVLEAMLDGRGLLWGTANAAPTPPTVPLFLVTFSCGTNMGRQVGDSNIDLWTPSGSGTTYTLSQALQALAPVKGDVNVVGGIENTATRAQYLAEGMTPGCNHILGAGTHFNGMPPNGQWDVNGPSVDQVAVTSLGLASATKYPVVGASQPFGNGDQTPNYTISWKGQGSPIPPYSDPKKLFAALFGGATTMDNGSGADDKSVLDYVANDVTALKARLGTSDQAILDQHLASIRAVEHEMSTTVSCSAPVAPNPTYPDTPLTGYDLRTPTLIQLLVMALQCDITRIVTLSLGPASDHAVFTWLNQTLDHHSISHQPGPLNSQILAYTNWNIQQFVNIVQSMKAATTPTGTLLGDSIVYMSSEVADGDLHNYDNLPILMAGTAGGQIATGRYIVFPHDLSKGTGTPLNNLWVTVLKAMGSSVTSFGVDGTASLPGLFM
jgi:hypothetical protein